MHIPSIASAPGGRISTRLDDGGLVVALPPKRNWFVIGFLGVWFTLWSVGGVFAISAVFDPDERFDSDKVFVLLWLCGWALGWVAAGRKLVWLSLGKEYIWANTDTLAHRKQVLGLGRARAFPSRDITRLDWEKADQEDEPSSAFDMSEKGRLVLDCRGQTQTLAKGINATDGAFILDKIRSVCPIG
ncbi:hypothetical protein [uncultured Cohaesibacter sp.]|uniref:hypothetical protein n=1 Tax=uncultured Cohaesibacter sp. TaxID=1002546 RepID=UPI0029301691|nr:hypothetical protein [uncultured Cohaesibacter sp.]